MQRQRHNSLAVNRGKGKNRKMEKQDKEGRDGNDGEMNEEEKGQGGSDWGLTWLWD